MTSPSDQKAKNRFKLNKDVYSNFKDKRHNPILYGKKGQEVDVISRMHDVWIVRIGITRFPCKKQDLEQF